MTRLVRWILPDGRGRLYDLRRFLLMGGLNTGFTIVVYEVLLFVVSPSVSYTLSWMAGLCLVLVAYPTLVFKGGKRTSGRIVALAALYISVYLFGLLLIRAILAQTPINDRLAIFLVILATLSVNFLGSRLIFRSGDKGPVAESETLT